MSNFLLAGNVGEPIPLIAGLQSCPQSAQAWIHTYTIEPRDTRREPYVCPLSPSLTVFYMYGAHTILSAICIVLHVC